MAGLLSLGIKDANGQWVNVTVGINDEVNEWGKNCSVWKTQSKEDREAKKPKEFIGGGKVVWTDGKIEKAPYQEQGAAQQEPTSKEDDTGLPF